MRALSCPFHRLLLTIFVLAISVNAQTSQLPSTQSGLVTGSAVSSTTSKPSSTTTSAQGKILYPSNTPQETFNINDTLVVSYTATWSASNVTLWCPKSLNFSSWGSIFQYSKAVQASIDFSLNSFNRQLVEYPAVCHVDLINANNGSQGAPKVGFVLTRNAAAAPQTYSYSATLAGSLTTITVTPSASVNGTAVPTNAKTGTAKGTSTSTSSGLTSTSSSAPTSGISSGASAGIGVGVALAVVSLAAGLGYFVWRKRRAANKAKASTAAFAKHESKPPIYQDHVAPVEGKTELAHSSFRANDGIGKTAPEIVEMPSDGVRSELVGSQGVRYELGS